MIHNLLRALCWLVGHDDVSVTKGFLLDSSTHTATTRRVSICTRCRRVA